MQPLFPHSRQNRLCWLQRHLRWLQRLPLQRHRYQAILRLPPNSYHPRWKDHLCLDCELGDEVP